jgi:hypothetical protein
MAIVRITARRGTIGRTATAVELNRSTAVPRHQGSYCP